MQFPSKVITSYSSNWIMLLLLCTGAPLVLCCDQFDCGSKQVKSDPVDLVTEDYDIILCWQLLLQKTRRSLYPLLRYHIHSSKCTYLNYPAIVQQETKSKLHDPISKYKKNLSCSPVVMLSSFKNLKGYSLILLTCFYDTNWKILAKKALFPKSQLLHILHLQIRHDYVHFIVPIEHCAELILVDETLSKKIALISQGNYFGLIPLGKCAT